MNHKHIFLLFTFALLVTLLLTLSVAPVSAGGTVTNCSDDTDFSSKLAGGGPITFNCGTATIVLSSTKTITANTTINGGGTITLSGGNALRLFIVNPGADVEQHHHYERLCDGRWRRDLQFSKHHAQYQQR